MNIQEITLAQAKEVHKDVFGDDYLDNFEKRTDGKKTILFGAIINEQLVGYVIAYDQYADGSLYCWMLGVKKEHRRKKVLTTLMDTLDKWAREQGYRWISIKTMPDNNAMISFLKKDYFNQLEEKEGKLFFEKEI